ncbi:helix-turn-helix transcriptional regulator [Thermostaphylospora chromogena]|uniref:Helix-turn-helix domain-containing protein n=1 Tax=Thermostaphylospora chromogena TaxID=35622 RepID=A0A1H1I3R0_9ACTN|nr:helix-turn-helix transcriptional regulator [Thermostaphylospora chromogena]SDR32334.1 Helix-turn-helix domain-containing protein [Thermostaphylospora chromogena]
MATTEFGQAVRRWRERVSPEAAGLPAGGHRRTPGLRREELAQLAGISADYLTRLEQGRATKPSEQVVEALARALQLSGPERAHLFQLGGFRAPGPECVPTRLPPSVQRLLNRLADTPVAVYDATWTLLVANPPYAALMGDPSGWRGHERNAVWRNFLGLGDRVRQTPQSRHDLQSALVADLRMATARYPADRRLRRLIADLRTHSDRFAELWDTGITGRHESARKTIDHPQAGAVTLDCDILTLEGSDLHVMVYTAEPGTEDAERLALITTLGGRALVG